LGGSKKTHGLGSAPLEKKNSWRAGSFSANDKKKACWWGELGGAKMKMGRPRKESET